MSNLFTEEKYNALMQALEECAEDQRVINRKGDVFETQPMTIYTWLESTPKTLLISSLVDKLEELGYIIVKK